MKKKSVTLLTSLLIPSVYAITQESLLDLYLEFYGWFDFLLYFTLFTGITKLAIESIFKKTGEDSKSISLLYISLGLLFSISLVTWEIKSGFYLYQLGPLILIIIPLLIIAWIWKYISSKKKGDKTELRTPIRYIAILILLLIIMTYVLFPNVLNYYFWSNWIEPVLAIAVIICIIAIIMAYPSSKKEKEIEEEESWWDRRKARKKEEAEEKERLKSEAEKEEKRKRAEEARIKEEERKGLKAERARIKAIGKIKCYIKAYSRLQNRILVNNDEIIINDKITFSAILENTSEQVEYNWEIPGKKIKRNSFEIYAIRLGKGKSKIRLSVKDTVTNHKSKDSLLLNVIEEEKPAERIREEQKPFAVKILGKYKNPKELGADELIEGSTLTKGAVIELNLSFPQRKPREYKTRWNVPIKGDHGIINTEHYFRNPGKKRIFVEVKDKETGKIATDTLTYNFIIPGIQTIEEKGRKIIKDMGERTKVQIKEAPQRIKTVPSKISRRWRILKHRKIIKNSKNILKSLESIKESTENQESYINKIYDLMPKTEVSFGNQSHVIELLDEVRKIEASTEKKQDKIYNILSKLKKSKDKKITETAILLRAMSEKRWFGEGKLDLKTIMNELIKNLKKEKINVSETTKKIKALYLLINIRKKSTEEISSRTKSLISYLES